MIGPFWKPEQSEGEGIVMETGGEKAILRKGYIANIKETIKEWLNGSSWKQEVKILYYVFETQ